MFGTVDDIIVALGGTSKVAEACGLSLSTVSSWKARDSIPANRWLDLVELGEKLGVAGVTGAALARLHSRRPTGAAPEVRP